MSLTPEQIALANAKGDTSNLENPDGRIPAPSTNPTTAPVVVPSKPRIATPAKGKEIESIAELPTAEEQDNPTEEVEQKDEKVIDYNDFLKASADDKTPLEDKTKKDETQVKPKKDEKLNTGLEETEEEVKAPVVERQTLTEKTAKIKDKQPRDLTDLPEELKVHFAEEMSRPAFNKLRPIVLEHNQLKQQNTQLATELKRIRDERGLPESYYEHPNAYMLTGEFQSSLQEANEAKIIAEHWEKQWSAVKSGAAEFDVIGYDNNGNLVITGKRPADASAEMTILRAVNTTQNQYIQKQAALQAMGQVHQEKYKNVANWISQHEQTNYDNPVFNTENGKKWLPAVNDTLKSFPQAVQANPLARALAKSIVVNYQLGLVLQQLQTGGAQVKTAQNGNEQVKPKTTKQVAVERKSKAGPTESDTGADAIGDGSKEKSNVTVDDFERVKQGF